MAGYSLEVGAYHTGAHPESEMVFAVAPTGSVREDWEGIPRWEGHQVARPTVAEHWNMLG